MKKQKALQAAQRAWHVKNVISNVLWFLLGGLWMGIVFGAVGLLLCITVVGIPFGKQCFQASAVAMFPYGKKVFLHIKRYPLANLIWGITVGWVLFLSFFLACMVQCLTVFGFFRARQYFKLAKIALLPFGTEVQIQ